LFLRRRIFVKLSIWIFFDNLRRKLELHQNMALRVTILFKLRPEKFLSSVSCQSNISIILSFTINHHAYGCYFIQTNGSVPRTTWVKS
jgi:hypothetical protein